MTGQEWDSVRILGCFPQRIGGKAGRCKQAEEAGDRTSEPQLSVDRRPECAYHPGEHDEWNRLVEQIKREQRCRIADDTSRAHYNWNRNSSTKRTLGHPSQNTRLEMR